ncbi:hypothetical protein TIFTF001_012592 [Ficus carica]|uniref:Uncharacterized protein n=1 Tax=Ficus carica TaxID=3494 RepID=A0AA88AG81_FICCA|nr:hypothetical protein TIFTF001_012592 [Ficus carica]
MPSGAKKRKAAKKKKELEATSNNNYSNNPQEHDDAKSQDGKGSDGGEVSSPAHQDHRNDNDHPFNEGNEVRLSSDARSIVAEDNSMEKVPSGAGVGGKVGFQGLSVPNAESSLKPEEHSERDISIEGFEFSKMGNKSSSSSSSSSSDDEARATRTRVSESKSYGFSNLVNPVATASGETLAAVESALVDNSLVSEVTKLETGAEKLANEVSGKVFSFSPQKYEDKLEAGAEKLANVATAKVTSSTKKYEGELEAGAEKLAKAVLEKKKYEEEKLARAVSEAKKQEEERLARAVSETKKYEDKVEAGAEKLANVVSETKKHEEERLAKAVSETKKYEDKLEAGAEKLVNVVSETKKLEEERLAKAVSETKKYEDKLEAGAENLAKAVSETVSSFSPKKYEDKVFSFLDEFSKVSAASPSESGPYSKGHDDRELPPSEGAHVAETTTGTENIKDSENKLGARCREPPGGVAVEFSRCYLDPADKIRLRPYL